MKGQILIINFEGTKAYLTEQKVLSLKQAGLPDTTTQFALPASWVIRVLVYKPTENRIFAEILSYHPHKQLLSDNQRFISAELSTIEKIGFKNIDTLGLLHTTSKGEEKKVIFPTKDKLPYRDERIHSQEIKDTFSISLKNIHFKAGYVSFEKRVIQLNRTIEFTVSNDNICEEFDAVKNYFGNVLNTKKFQFDVVITIDNDEITGIETTSPEIERIDTNLIDNVKLEFLKGITKKKIDPGTEKSILTIEELFDSLTDEQLKANVFYDSEDALVEDLLKITNTKHYRHLRFLSKKHAHSIMKLRFVIKPFSFIFLIEGKIKYHIVWETLNTKEATYIWHEEKDPNSIRLAVERIDRNISQMKAQGKTTYVKSTNEDFMRIVHDYSDTDNGFIKWKNELERVLI